jgi:hypothetical protein
MFLSLAFLKHHKLKWGDRDQLYLLGPTEQVSFLPDDGDRLQSPKRRVFLIKDRRWLMSKKFVILTTHHRHKPSEFTYHKLKLEELMLLSETFRS